MQKFSDSIELPACAADVVSAITTEDYVRYRYESDELIEFGFEVKQDDEQAFSYEVRRVVDMKGRVPGIAKRLVGDRMAVLQAQSWTRVGPDYQGRLDAKAEGLPGRITGKVKLEPMGDSCSKLSFVGEVHVDIRIIGAQLEKFLLGRAADSFQDSMQAIKGYLAKL